MRQCMYRQRHLYATASPPAAAVAAAAAAVAAAAAAAAADGVNREQQLLQVKS